MNEYRRGAFGGTSRRHVAFVCEYADERCRHAILLTVAEYDAARATGRAVVVDASHESPFAGER